MSLTENLRITCKSRKVLFEAICFCLALLSLHGEQGHFISKVLVLVCPAECFLQVMLKIPKVVLGTSSSNCQTQLRKIATRETICKYIRKFPIK